jgi:hypothetical protein
VLSVPVVLLISALTPAAVLKDPLVLLRSASKPVAVLLRSGVVLERAHAGGGVMGARGIAKERVETNSSIAVASGEVEERILALRRVLVRIASVRWRANRESIRGWRQRKHREAERDEKKTTPPMRLAKRGYYGRNSICQSIGRYIWTFFLLPVVG